MFVISRRRDRARHGARRGDARVVRAVGLDRRRACGFTGGAALRGRGLPAATSAASAAATSASAASAAATSATSASAASASSAATTSGAAAIAAAVAAATRARVELEDDARLGLRRTRRQAVTERRALRVLVKARDRNVAAARLHARRAFRGGVGELAL